MSKRRKRDTLPWDTDRVGNNRVAPYAVDQSAKSLLQKPATQTRAKDKYGAPLDEDKSSKVRRVQGHGANLTWNEANNMSSGGSLTPVEDTPLSKNINSRSDRQQSFTHSLSESLCRKRSFVMEKEEEPVYANQSINERVKNGQPSSSIKPAQDDFTKPAKFVKVLPNETTVDVERSAEGKPSTSLGGTSSGQTILSLSRRRSSYAKGVTWHLKTGRHSSMDQDSQHSLSGFDVLEQKQQRLLKSGQSGSNIYDNVTLDDLDFPTQKAKTKNKRAKMNCCRLMCYDFKKYLKRRRNKAWENPLFKEMIQNVESSFGSGLVAFFIFTRWMIMLNVFLFIFWASLVIIPQAIVYDYSKMEDNLFVRNIIDGQDGLSDSWLFFGCYEHSLGIYPLNLGYFISIIVTYYGSLMVVLKSIAQAVEDEGVRETDQDHRYKFFLLTISAWDYSIKSREASRNLSKGIANTLKDMKSDMQAKEKMQSLSTKQKVLVFLRRLTAWLITLVLIGLGCAAIFYMNISVDMRAVLAWMGYEVDEEHVVVTFAPLVVFLLINSLVPICLYQLPRMERYVYGRTELSLTISRVFVLRMANLLALVFSLYKKVDQVVVQLCTKFAMYLWTHNKKEFQMPPVVLVIVYRQALIWLGSLVCPLMPLLGVLSMSLLFAVQYLILTVTCKPPKKRWNQPRRSLFFQGLTLATLIILIIPISVTIGRNDIVQLGQVGEDKNKFCGPFENVSIIDSFSEFRSDLEAVSPNAAEVITIALSGTVLTPFVFILLGIVYFQRLRVGWESAKRKVLTAELLEEREMNKLLHKELHVLKQQ